MEENQLDNYFKLKILHDVATGLNQLHRVGIAHQDTKPSNILVVDNNHEDNAKITDLGRSSSKDIPFKNDHFLLPGDTNYMPIERFCGYRCSNEFVEKYTVDLYGLGNLMLFLFSGCNMTNIIRNRIDIKGETYEQIRPEVGRIVGLVLVEYKKKLLSLGFQEGNASKMTEMLRYLCNDTPEIRGGYRKQGSNVNYDLERYITEFDLLSKKAQQGQL